MKFKSLECYLKEPLRNGLTKPKRVRGQGIKMVNMGELFSTPIIDNIEMDRVPLSGKERSSLLQKGDLLFARQSLVREGAGQCSIFLDDLEEVCFESHIIRCRIDTEKANPLFLFYYFKSAVGKQHIDRYVEQGAGAAGIRGSDLLKVLVPDVAIDVQNYVADVAYKFDKKITTNSTINQTLEEMAQAIFKSWFIDFDPVKAKMNGEQPEGMDETTAALFPDKLVESELGLIPEGWEIDTIGNHIKLTKGQSYKSVELQESTTALVTLKSFKRGGGYRMDGLKEYSGSYKAQQVIEAGELVMSLTDVTQAAEIVGKPALVIAAPQYEKLVASLDVAILRPRDKCSKHYFYGLMSTYHFHRHAESFASGTTVLHLSTKGITNFKFASPDVDTIKKYHLIASPIFAKIEANILESQNLEKLRDTLLPKLLSGEIELNQTEELAEVAYE